MSSRGFSCGCRRKFERPSSHTSIADPVRRRRAGREVTQRTLAEQLELTLTPPILVGFCRENPRRFSGVELTAIFVAGREVVVPEQGHLFLQRALCVNHPEQPALTRVGDVRRREKLPSRGDRYVSWLADVVVNDVVDLFVGEQPGKGEGRTAESKAGVDIDFLLRRAKSGAAKNVVDLLLPSAGHVAAPEGLSMTALDRAGQENTVLRPECICLDRPGRQRCG